MTAIVKKDGDYFVDKTGKLFQTPDGKPPATYDTQVRIGTGNGQHVPGRWIDQQAVPDKKS